MFEKKKSGEPSEGPPAQPLQYTKRKNFLFFKIRSKPVYSQPRHKAAARPRRRIRGLGIFEWIIALAAAALVALLLKPFGVSIMIAALAAVAVYILFFGIFSTVEARRSRKELLKTRIKMGLFGAVKQEEQPRTAAKEEREAEDLIRPRYPEQRAQAYGPGYEARAAEQKVDWRGRPVLQKGQAQGYQKAGREERRGRAPGAQGGGAKGPLAAYINRMIASRKNLEIQLREAGIRKSPYDFVKGMMVYALAIAVVVTIVLGVLLSHFSAPVILAPLMGIAIYLAAFNRFMMYPSQRSRVIGKQVERDILFAARDVVIGMRSGMPLYNAITAVSTGYGAASKEFGKIIELVQLGLPIEQAMEEVSDKSESRTFKRLMLQASVSIRAGVDVTGALQDVVDEVMQERVIDLRRYGQKLNALAMFYMLFGVIFPSMGIAVATIMSTFINIFPITYVVLVLALVFIAFVQLVLLNIMRTSRPIFVM